MMISGKTIILAILFCLFLSACASVEQTDGSAGRYAEIISHYPQSDGPLLVKRLTDSTALSVSPGSENHDVIIMVHPGYSFFFKSGRKDRYYTGSKFSLMEEQFSGETRFIENQARVGDILILIIPGNYQTDSVSPRSYTSFLNAIASGGKSVYYIPSETSSNGTIDKDDMVSLYRFLQVRQTPKVLVGGGYISRCQREFYSQFTTYYEKARTYIVREVSAISPDDVSEREASLIVSGIQRRDYAPVGNFLSRKLGADVNILSIFPLQ